MMRLPLAPTESREADLTSEGWTKQFSASDPRLSEMVSVFESLGKEVRLETECRDELRGSDCEACLEAHPNGVWAIWTRGPTEDPDSGESEYVRASDSVPTGTRMARGLSVSSVANSKREGSVLVVEIENPPVNIIDSKVISVLIQALDEAEADTSCCAMVISGSGTKGFSAGASIEEHLPDQATGMIGGMTDLLERLGNTPLVTLAAVHGICLGGGAEVALACDFVVTSEDSRIGIPEITVGCYPPFAMLQLPSLVGMRRAKQMILTGTPISGQEAADTGLVSKCVRNEDLMRESMEMLAPILSNPPQVVEMALRNLRSLDTLLHTVGHRRMGERFLTDLILHPDYTEGLTAFLEKRDPEWQSDRSNEEEV
jgi:cyclohexa-1,5-dienecarbonyl-CoA hydratase